METNWVRTTYLYVMCAVSIFLIASGAVTGVIAATNVISPSLGHRDMLDRVGIGVADIAKEIITVVTRQTPEQQDSIIEFCEDFYPADEVDQCISDQDPSQQLGPVIDGITKVKDELESQIRYNALARLVRGIALLVVGLLLWRIHAHRTDLYRDGVRRPKPIVPSLPTIAPPSEPPAAAPPATASDSESQQLS